MKNLLRILLVLGVSGLIYGLSAARVYAQDNQLALRASLGTDISAGLGYGIGLRFLRQSGSQAMEFGPDFFYAKSTETSTEYGSTYDEKTELSIFAVRINWLSDYNPKAGSVYWIYGTGAAAISVYWEESSAQDKSLGTPCCNGGSMQSEDGTAFGAIFSIGAGKSLSEKADLRVEFPIIIIPAPVGGAAAFVPTATVSLGVIF